MQGSQDEEEEKKEKKVNPYEEVGLGDKAKTDVIRRIKTEMGIN